MKKVAITTIILIVVVGVAAFLNVGDLVFKQESQENAIFKITSNGQEIVKVDMNMIKGIQKVDFDANLKKSGQAPVKHSYTGVPLASVLKATGVTTNGIGKVVFKAVDGYTSVLTLNEAMQEDNVFIVYAMDNKPLGNKENDGSGPYEMVIKNDQFSQRWCKFLTEVELQ